MTAKADILTRWFEEVWNQGLEATIFELCDPEVVLHGGGPEPMRGVEAVRNFWKSIRSKYPGVRVEVEQVIEGPHGVACRSSSKMPHPQTGEMITLRGSTFATIEDGRFTEVHDVWDFSTLLEAMGSVPQDSLVALLHDSRE